MSDKVLSEKIYAWLLRLYPADFRQAYGDEAWQLFRDRARDETGFFPRLRLWLDLVLDLAVSIPRQYRRFQLMGAPGAPLFHVLESESLRPRALFFGAILSLAAFGMGIFLVGHGGRHWTLTPTGGAGEDAISSGLPVPKDPAATAGPAIENIKLDAAERSRVVQAVVADVTQYYIDAGVARQMADRLLAHQKAGDYDTVSDGSAFADLLTAHLQDVSHDRRVFVEYIWSPKFAGLPPPHFDMHAFVRKQMERYCTFEEIEILPHNIGYLLFSSFPDPSLCRTTAAAAMAKLNHADAIIFDLRNNRGGSREMAAFLSTYLFDHPTHLNDYYYRAENSTLQSWTLAPVPGNSLAHKPAYVLTSHATLSGAEEFSYDLQMLKRATLVGENTAGVANITHQVQIDQDFFIFVPAAKAINPISKANWETTGVEPDVKVNAANALDVAEMLAETKVQKR